MTDLIADMLFSALLALLVLGILVRIMGWQRSPEAYAAADIFLIFAFVFLLVWAGGIWIPPFRPIPWGSYVVSFIVAAGFALALLACIGPPGGRRSRTVDPEAAARPWRRTFYVLFSILMLALILSIVARYTIRPRTYLIE